MSIWFDYCELKFNTISIVRFNMLRKAIKVGLYCVFVLVSKVSMYNKK
jgi:hypothetical protein